MLHLSLSLSLPAAKHALVLSLRDLLEFFTQFIHTLLWRAPLWPWKVLKFSNLLRSPVRKEMSEAYLSEGNDMY